MLTSPSVNVDFQFLIASYINSESDHLYYPCLFINVFDSGASQDGVGLCTQETLTKLPRSTPDPLVVVSTR